MNNYKITIQELINSEIMVSAESETAAQHIVSQFVLGSDYPNEIGDINQEVISWEIKKVEKV